jgi:PhnB protein
MAQFDPYLFFDGNCAEAMRFYEKALGGKIEMMMTHGQSPMAADVSKANADRIMHASLALDGQVLMASDGMAGEPHPGFHGFSLSMTYPKVADAKRIFDALAAGGKVVMAPADTFWVESFGMLVDRYGVSWMISGGKSKI